MDKKNYIIRKVRDNGANTLIISIPGEFVKDIKLKSGDYIKITENKDSLEIEKTGL